MKKVLAMAIVPAILFGAMLFTGCFCADEELNGQHGQGEEVTHPNLQIVVDNTIIDGAEAYIADGEVELVNLMGVTIVPLQAIMEVLGLEFDYVSEDLRITISGAEFALGGTEVRIDGEVAFEFLVAPYQGLDGYVYIPVTFFRDALGFSVWSSEGQLVISSFDDMH